MKIGQNVLKCAKSKIGKTKINQLNFLKMALAPKTND